MERICPECGNPIFGRADKKFCSDQCRTAHYNETYGTANSFIRNINKILRKNRRILVDLNPKGKVKVPRERLIEKGFNFDYFTNQYVTKSGNVYHFCYDYGYLKLNDGTFALVVRKEYVG